MKESGRKLLLYAAKIVPSKCTLQLVIQMTMPKIVDLKTFPTFTPTWRNQTEDSVNVPSKLLSSHCCIHVATRLSVNFHELLKASFKFAFGSCLQISQQTLSNISKLPLKYQNTFS